jgi:hypothetical protein
MRLRVLLAIVFIIIALFSCKANNDQHRPDLKNEELLVLSFPKVSLQENERIVGLEITITHGSVKAINNIPEDWSVDLKTDPQWQPKVSGAPHHGAGALNDLSEVDSLLVIRPWREKGYELDIVAKVFTTIDFEKTRTRSFRMDELILKRKSS